MSHVQAAVRVGRWVVVAVSFLSVAIGLLLAAGSTGSLPAIAAVGTLLFAGLYLLSPYAMTVTQSTREPTEEEANLLASLLDRAGASNYRVRVLDRTSEGTTDTIVRGLPGYRYLFASDHLLDAYDRPVAEAKVALAIARAGTNWLLFRSVAGVSVIGIALVPVFYGRLLIGLTGLVVATALAFAVGSPSARTTAPPGGSGPGPSRTPSRRSPRSRTSPSTPVGSRSRPPCDQTPGSGTTASTRSSGRKTADNPVENCRVTP